MKQTICILGLFVGLSPVRAAYYDVPVNQPIPDGKPAGMLSSTTIAGESGQIGSLKVTLSITGTANGDLYAYLTHGSGFVVLLNRVGKIGATDLGYADPGMNVVFSNSGTDIHYYGGASGLGTTLTGTWRPDGRDVNPFDVVGSDVPTTFLSSFTGINPNGKWTLFVADVETGDTHQLNSWGLDVAIAAVPESTTFFTGIAALGMFCLFGKRVRCSASL